MYIINNTLTKKLKIQSFFHGIANTTIVKWRMLYFTTKLDEKELNLIFWLMLIFCC